MVKDSRMVQQPGILLNEVHRLIRSPKARKELATNLHETYRPKAAKELADILINLSQGGEDEKEQ